VHAGSGAAGPRRVARRRPRVRQAVGLLTRGDPDAGHSLARNTRPLRSDRARRVARRTDPESRRPPLGRGRTLDAVPARAAGARLVARASVIYARSAR